MPELKTHTDLYETVHEQRNVWVALQFYAKFCYNYNLFFLVKHFMMEDENGETFHMEENIKKGWLFFRHF